MFVWSAISKIVVKFVLKNWSKINFIIISKEKFVWFVVKHTFAVYVIKQLIKNNYKKIQKNLTPKVVIIIRCIVDNAT